MDIDFTFAPWGMVFAAVMFIAGNGAWMNPLARKKALMGWGLWSLSAIIILIIGGVIEQQLDGSSTASAWERLTSVEAENHWITLTLYALLSIPGAATILFRQSVSWTRLATVATAIIVFIPLGIQLQNPNNSYLLLSLSITAGSCALLWIWSKFLDCEPKHQRKTVPLEEMSQ